MKRFITLFLSVCMILLSGCNAATTDSGDNTDSTAATTVSDTEKVDETEAQNFKRLKSISFTYEDIEGKCNITWDNGVCNFESYMNYYKDPIENYKAVLDTETMIYSMIWFKEDGTTMELPIFRYDENQQIVEVFNEDDPTESWAVTYDEHGVATLAGNVWFEYDAATKTITKQISSGSTYGKEHKTYEIATIDELGNFVSVSRIKYVDDGSGNFEKATEDKDYKKYTYDEDGNLIKYEEPGNDILVIEFEYYDEPISHAFERTIPIHYIDIFDIYYTPFIWYVK